MTYFSSRENKVHVECPSLVHIHLPLAVERIELPLAIIHTDLPLAVIYIELPLAVIHIELPLAKSSSSCWLLATSGLELNCTVFLV